MDDREQYICILEKAAALASDPGRTEPAKRIDRRIMTSAAAGAMRLGIPVRVSDDGLFLTIDLGGRSYTVIAAAVEAVLREDYDRALNVCRFMASKAGEVLAEECEESFENKDAAGRNGLRIFAAKCVPVGKTCPRFESRAERKNAAIPLPEDRGEGGVPENMTGIRGKFCPARGKTVRAAEKVTVTVHGLTGKKKTYLFAAEPREECEGAFCGFFLTVRDGETGKILHEEECAGETEFSAAGTHFRVIGVRKDGAFHPGIMLAGPSAGTCTMVIDDGS